jgi:hypothetical protein
VVVEEKEEEGAEAEADEERFESEAEFGILQSAFKPYSPEWESIWQRPRQIQDGTYVFKVTLGGWRRKRGIWRRLAVPGETSLDSLAGLILDAFEFDEDHLYDFRYRDLHGKSRVYNHPYTHEGPFTTDISVGATELPARGEMLFTFDYGDNWQFEVRFERLEVGPNQVKAPEVIDSVGEAPEQYSQW